MRQVLVADRDGPVVAGDLQVLEGLVGAAVFGSLKLDFAGFMVVLLVACDSPIRLFIYTGAMFSQKRQAECAGIQRGFPRILRPSARRDNLTRGRQ